MVVANRAITAVIVPSSPGVIIMDVVVIEVAVSELVEAASGTKIGS